MAKKYNIKDKYIGGFVFFKKGYLTNAQYREKWIDTNIGALLHSYRRVMERAANTDKVIKGAYATFAKKYPDVYTWARTLIKGRTKRGFSVKKIKELVATNIGFTEVRYGEHIKTLIEDSPYADEFRLRIGNQIDANRLSYEGNSTYTYYCEDGTYLRFMFSDYSPTILIFLENEE